MNWKALGVNLLFATMALTSDDFKSASVLYDGGKYPAAAAAFEKITPKTAAVYFNLGNAHFRLEQLGRAVLDFERARQLAPTDPDILANLRFAEERLGVADVNSPAKPLARFWESLTGSRTIGQWARYEVGGIWLAVAMVAGAIWLPRLRICNHCSGCRWLAGADCGDSGGPGRGATGRDCVKRQDRGTVCTAG